MDDVFSTMNIFEQELEGFNERLKASFNDSKKYHELVDPIWDDNMRREYDSTWLQLEESMNQYLSADGEGYVQVLIEKLNAIRGYLYGN